MNWGNDKRKGKGETTYSATLGPIPGNRIKCFLASVYVRVRSEPRYASTLECCSGGVSRAGTAESDLTRRLPFPLGLDDDGDDDDEEEESSGTTDSAATAAAGSPDGPLTGSTMIERTRGL